ncbi:E3 ubiquitin-protein ligase tom1 [Diplodia seriata]|uniref:HECT-type E3 ubiquitin transferase n=1 Tax=Diplodia seriata TaxID=420778 RepID=A0ABR3CE87_9PEZI
MSSQSPSQTPDEQRVAEARAAVTASLSSVGGSMNAEMRQRAADIHANAAAIEKQEKELAKQTAALAKDGDKWQKMADQNVKKLNEMGDLQNWTEMIERDLLVSPYIADFIKETLALPLHKIPAHLSTFPRRWPFPRGDLYHWIPVLNRFDRVLELFVEEYALVSGPQAQPFGRRLLLKGDAEEGKQSSESLPGAADLDAAGYTAEGDRELLEEILRFTKLLLENCGNRSLYASSEHLSKLLNTTSLPLLRTTLRLTLRLAQRYHTSRVRMGSSSTVQNSLLISHYNINLDNLLKIALPFVKGSSPASGKGKDKLTLSPSTDAPSDKVQVADLVGKVKFEEIPPALREEWGSVFLSYYDTTKDEAGKPAPPEPFASPGGAPSTPTPVRRSTLGPNATPRQNRAAPTEQSPRTPVTPNAQHDGSRPAGPKFLEVPYREISSQPCYEVMRSYAQDVPEETRYELLHRVRVAQSLVSDRAARENIVAIRLLAIANLAYVHPETTFHQKIGQPDADEPRPLQLAYQLAELIHPPADGQLGASRELQTTALCALEALTKHKNKGADLTSALSLNVNHGVLFYVARKAVAELTRDDGPGDSLEDDEWRESLFTLLTSIPGQVNRMGESMVAAGLFDIFVEVLTLRTQRSERYYSRVLSFLDTFAFNLRDAFQAFVQAKGLDAIADLAGHEVESAYARAERGEGMPDQYKTQHTDYKIAYYPQQTLRWLFKFISHMMTHGGGGIDRLLRNLMDSPRLLAGLRTVLAEAPVFGSTVWSMTVNILANFIHHEPTSYAIIAEAGLSKTFLETVTQRTIEEKAVEATTENVTETPSQSDAPITKEEPPADKDSKPATTGILPVAEAIASVPPAFGAICLTEAGLNLFKNSTALESFFEVFTSPAHVKAIEVDSETTQTLGSSFDELVRHHPPLKQAILASVKNMVARVGKLCFERAQHKGVGSKLWVESGDGKILVSGGRKALWGKEGNRHQQSSNQGDDVEMTDVDISAASAQAPNVDVSIDDVVEQEDPKDGPTTTQFITAACKFLEGFFINESLCSAFIEEGGLEFILDFGTLPCLPYNFNEYFAVGEEFSRVIQMIVEQKPHLALPSLIRRFQAACDELEPFMRNDRQSAYLAVFTSRNAGADVDAEVAANGTRFAKALVVVLTLANALSMTFQGSMFNHRSSHNIFSLVNMGDMYAHLIDSLGRLQRCCVWEEILLQKEIPSDWEKSTRVKSSGFSTDEANNILRLTDPRHPEEPSDAATTDTSGQQSSAVNSGDSGTSQAGTALDKASAQYKNTKVLRYLLSQVPTAITPFLQALGKCLLFRRAQDQWMKQNAFVVADQLAKLALDQLSYELPKKSADAKDRYAYWIVILTSISQILMEGSMDRSPPHMLTLILGSFQSQGGLDQLSGILDSFFEEAKGIIEKNDSQELPEDVQGLMNLALGGVKIVLTLYAHMVNPKCVIDAHQTNAMNTRDRNRPKGDSFFPSQFLVELRMAVIKPVEKIWNSELMNKATTSIVKNLVEILRIVLDSEGENEAYKRAETPPARSRFVYKPWKARPSELLENLKRDGFEDGLAKEAQYRSYDNAAAAREYCNAAKNDARFSRNPVPPYETELLKQTDQTPSTSTTPRLTAESEDEFEEPGSQSIVMSDAQPIPTEPATSVNVTSSSVYIPHAIQNSAWGRGTTATDAGSAEYIRVEDLEDARSEVRKNVIDRALEVVDVHEDVTFELADLISAAVAKSSDASSMRTEIGETLVNALISLQSEEDLRPIGKKIASYAHLLALILQEREFYKATLPQLKEYFSQLLGFIKTSPEQRGEESSPWIGHVLLIIERMLADDAQPPQIQWTPPRDDDADDLTLPAIELPEPVVPEEDKRELFNAIVEVLPRIGKDESLALSVARVLVTLTRNRQLATKLGEKRNLQRLFVMVKQLSGITNERLQGSFMLILRHIVEDEETIRQIMRTEIKALFKEKGSRPRNTPQQMDTTAYVRALWNLAIRSPEIFVEVTNEKLKLTSYARESRSQNFLELKEEEAPADKKPDEKSGTEGDQPAESSKAVETVKPSTEVEAKGEPEKPKPADTKPPVIENPDGVIHYLLCELLTYKDVDDKEPAAAPTEQSKDTPAGDVEMTDSADRATPVTPGSTASTPAPAPEQQKKSEKPTFKADQNPIFIYRCFILQCLTELLTCYNKTKVEFVTFSRQADPQAMTPSKPRSTVLRYILENLVPVGTLAHAEDISFKKKCATSNWAISVVVALCQKTGERRSAKGRDAKEEDESELLFVRKFVLEHALRAFKDANASSELLDMKYSRLLNLADLFHRMLYGKPTNSSSSFPVDMIVASQKQLARIMYEKNFITTLTTAIADIDLNFPNAKRAVKYILRPIKLLTQTAIELSLNAEISGVPGQADEDEISTASSVSDMDEFREETPDLFRNSTLAMFDPSRDEETESEESDEDDDEDMYGDEYGDEMEYEEDMEHDGDDVVSDEDEEIEGMGDIEGLSGDVGDDVEIVIEGEDGDDMSEDDDDSADMDEDDEDPENDEDIEIMDDLDDVPGDDINDSLNGDEDDEWASEDDEGDDYDEDGADEDHGPPGGIDNLVRILDGQGGPGLLEHLQGDMMDMEHEGYLDDEMQEDEGIFADLQRAWAADRLTAVDEEDEEEDYDEDDIAYEAGLEGLMTREMRHLLPQRLLRALDDEDGIPDPAWGWGAPPDFRGHHHHHHRHGIIGVNPFSFIPPATLDRHLDDGTNPLLQRSGRPSSGAGGSSGRRAGSSDWVHAMDPMRPGRFPPGGDTPVSFISNLLNIMSHGSATIQQDGITVTVQGMFPGDPGFPDGTFDPYARRDRRGHDHHSRSSRDDPAQAVSFVPTLTTMRWQEEGRLLFGSLAIEKSVRIVNSILRLLVPPAIKATKEAERKEREEREAHEKELIEREKRERQEREEKEARDKKEKEEREAEEARRLEAERSAQEQPAEAATEDQQMADAGVSQPAAAVEGETAAQGETAQAQNRVVANLRGRDIDITDLGIDLEYLEALPEDLREEVLMAQIQTQREEARTQGTEPSDISREFLDALPEDIRDELLQQEAVARRRQVDAEESRRQGAPPRAEEMDVATLFASMDPGLRQAVLMEQDDETLRELPQELAEEARRLGGDRRLNHHIADIGRLNRGYRRHDGAPQEEEHAQRKQKPRPIVQMLEKSGVATLLRLMFIPQQGSARQTLNGILKDVCQNRHNRAEVISILLSILQDGSADINAVERSFAQLSLRAKQPPAPQPSGTQKTPQPLKRSLTGPLAGQQLSTHGDMSPIMVVQQCLSTLVYLVYNNPHVASFFLAEHETAVGFKSKAYRKGKAKESKAYKYPLNALLSLLDRKLIVESSTVMEQLASLLMNITSPLGILLKKDKEKSEEKKDEPAEASTSAQQQIEGTAPETTETSTTAEQTTTAEQATEQAPEQPMEQTATQTDDPAAASTEKKDEKKTEDKPDDKKKARGLVPPEVPEYNLRLVVHILAARECSSKTFQNTLSVINNLSAIPGAKETFGKELIKQGQDLAQSCLGDLDELVSQVTKAKTGTDVQGMALSKFSPASSDQTKLLRVLTALDYLFDPKRSETQDKPASSVADGLPAEQKADILTTLYENPTFSSLWHKLSECLTVIRERTNMLSVATILLPLIEVLMVVCKNTTLKDAPLAKLHAREVELSSPPPENRMESLFFKFTEEHRKILNELVRQNPKLMSGSFSVLVRNSKVLEFDNKRNFFNRRLHSRGAELRHPHPTLQLAVRREHVFLDSFKSLYFKTGDEMKYGKLSIRFHGEEGVDAGGVTREWFQVLARQMFNPDYALFIPVASDRTTFHPNRLSAINQEHLLFFKFIGRIIGKALYEGRVLDCHFSRAVYKRILGKPVSIKDMETLDLDYYKSLLWMLENDITDIITETFSVEAEEFGVTQTIDLIPNGRNIPVTEENKQEYVRLMVEYKLTGSVQDQLTEFLKGFHDIVPAELISIFNEQELELLISGLPEIDVDDWKNNAEYHNYTAASPQIQWFWRAVRAFDKEERAKLLQFVTGTSKVPLNGFKELEGMNGFSRFNIHRDYGSKDRLPSSHTCFNQLDLPEYETYEALRQQLHTAITAGSEYFGFA